MQGTPSILRKSHSNTFTPNSTRFLNSTTLAGSPFKEVVNEKEKGMLKSEILNQQTIFHLDLHTPTLPFTTSQIILQDNSAAISEKINLSLLPIRDQEALIIEDLLYVLLGVDGEFITRVYDSHSEIKQIVDFSIDEDLGINFLNNFSLIFYCCRCFIS
jgi:hypothetical protein